jgi:hypothetical protein
MARAKKIVEHVETPIVKEVINTTECIVLHSFKGNINNKPYKFTKGDRVSLTKGELSVFGHLVKRI